MIPSTSFDPSRRLDLYFRVARAGSKIFTFTDSSGTAVDVSGYQFQLNIKKNSGARTNVISLTVGGGLTVGGSGNSQLTAAITVTQSTINEGEYYWELYKGSTSKTYLSGRAVFHYGAFDGVENDTTDLTVSDETTTVTIELSDGGSSGDLSTKFDRLDGTLEGVASPAYSQGKLVYNSTNDSLEWMNGESDIRLQIGQEHYIKVYNSSGSTIANGRAVYITGVNAGTGLPTVGLAQANAASTYIGIGFATHSIENNSIGYVTQLGRVNNIDTSAFSVGAIVYLSSTSAGLLTTTAPTFPNYRVRMGHVVVSDASVGVILATLPTYAQPVGRVIGTQDTINNNGVANTLTDAVGYAFPGVSGNRMRFKIVIPYDSAATTTGARFVLDGGSAPTLLYGYNQFSNATGGGTGVVVSPLSAYNTPAAAGAGGTTTGNVCIMEGFVTPSVTQDIKVRFSSEVAGSAITVKAGGWIEYEYY